MKPFIITIFFISLFIIVIASETFGENPDTTLNKIRNNYKTIKYSSRLFNINSSLLCSVIYTERTLNYNWEDKALDIVLAQSGLNSSIGFCQIKVGTAYWIEQQLADTNSLYYCGEQYNKILPISKSLNMILKRLQKDSINILYAAAYIKIMELRWEKCGYPISDRPDIIGTLYSTGLFYTNGRERSPRKNPHHNKFGKIVNDSEQLFLNPTSMKVTK